MSSRSKHQKNAILILVIGFVAIVIWAIASGGGGGGFVDGLGGPEYLYP